MPKLLTVKEVSALTRLSRATIYSYIAAKKIPYNKIGTRVLFEEQQIIKWIEARRVTPINNEFSNV